MVIADNTPAKKVSVNVFKYIKDNWSKSKKEIMKKILELHIDTHISNIDGPTDEKTERLNYVEYVINNIENISNMLESGDK